MMRLDAGDARGRLVGGSHGVLATVHPRRGADAQPVVYAVSGDRLGIPIDKVKPKASGRLQREQNLAGDPRATLLLEHWDAGDWSRLWWVRAELRFESDPPGSLIDDLADRLAGAIPQYADRPFHRVLVFRILAVTGWSSAEV